MPLVSSRLAWLPVVLGGIVLAAVAIDWWHALPEGRTATYVGRHKCTECHATQVSQWMGSHHERAMATATPENVLGDFDDAELTHYGVTSRMFRRDDGYYISTEGPSGEIETFRIKYTFGWTPLQQYLVEFDDGRVQALSVAWDTEEKRWFHLYPDEPIPHDDPLHWTKPAQNWNYMCAECHSTDLQKNYDLASDTYATTFSEINVSCEACHGPGSMHVELAEAMSLFWDRRYGYGLAPLKEESSKTELETCAKCHARRRIVYPGFEPGDEFLDYYAPELMENDLYFVDGQIRDEVYEYGSFLQSRMYREGVRCTDCHDPHKATLKFEGNQLCGQCHVPAKYDSTLHHFHPLDSPGASCVNCHMPERTYMVVDPRRDHSLRIPRPDLSVSLGTPNACNDCHDDQSAEWAAERVIEWYGPERRGDPHFAHAFAAARDREPEGEALLVQAARRRDNGPFVRASAVALLRHYPGRESLEAIERALTDTEPLVRAAGVSSLESASPRQLVRLLAPRLHDPVRLVRTEAARLLARVPSSELAANDREAFEAAIEEYRTGQLATDDQPAAHLNLGVLHENLNRTDLAAESYRRALRLDASFVPAKNNLALLKHAQGDAEAAERLFRELVEAEPDFGPAWYSLGLLLAEQEGRLADAVDALREAARLQPDNARLRYNLGLALVQLERRSEAEAELTAAHQLSPADPDIVYGLVSFYVQGEDWNRAAEFARRLVELRPGDPAAQNVLRQVEAQRQRPRPAGPGQR